MVASSLEDDEERRLAGLGGLMLLVWMFETEECISASVYGGGGIFDVMLSSA